MPQACQEFPHKVAESYNRRSTVGAVPTPLNQKPATAAWIVRERKRLKLKPRDLVERLGAQGLVVSEATVKVWESNADRRPAPENLEGLERIFESTAPGTSAPSDQSDLASAIRALVEEMRLDRQEQVRWREAVQEALVAALNARVDGAPTDGPASQPHEGAPR